MKHVWPTTSLLLIGLLEVFKMCATAAHQCQMPNICCPGRKPEPYHHDTTTAWINGYKIRYHIFRCNCCDENWREEKWRIKEKNPLDLIDWSP
ncbi:hypothetical protein PGT21_027819 [Puccinia graminis f. sp. tritici]|uniref:Uncharacterized protein n=1 Tax=Puccinia graminis f. sp. tritici TaxID=56615 RepID=A0A5B0NSQ2_PUCGR|nr:hypothetical protein PGTUg99_018981 [Puccinia graminis f. sp. tritici]KAA1091180.1 hypothetical protein PGT21_027819 [Puccinia graminis f. sp. tritici]